MLIEEIVSDLEERLGYKKQGKTAKLKYRCGSGPRAGKLVSDPKMCQAKKNMAKSRSMKKTMTSKGKTMTRRSNRSKKSSSASRAVRSLNKK